VISLKEHEASVAELWREHEARIAAEEARAKEEAWLRRVREAAERPSGIACPTCAREMGYTGGFSAGASAISIDGGPIERVPGPRIRRAILCPSCGRQEYRTDPPGGEIVIDPSMGAKPPDSAP
jgi:hypothetical protein